MKIKLNLWISTFIISPLVIGVVGLIVRMPTVGIVISLANSCYRYFYSKKHHDLRQQFIVQFIFLSVHMILYFLVITGNNFKYIQLPGWYWIVLLPYGFLGIFLIYNGAGAIPVLIFITFISSLLGIGFYWWKTQRRLPRLTPKIIAPILLVASLAIIPFFLNSKHNELFVGSDYHDTSKDEIDYHEPKGSLNDENYAASAELAQIPKSSNLQITSDYPQITGAAEFSPLAVGLIELGYEGIAPTKAQESWQVDTTDGAFKKLLKQKTDLVLMPKPTPAQEQAAKKAGLKLNKVPIAKEALVFLVNHNNTIMSLTPNQMRKIYQGKFMRWQQVCDEKGLIQAFQNDPASNSQIVMKELVMKGKSLRDPLQYQGTFGIQTYVKRANYDNNRKALGYATRIDATKINSDSETKILDVNEIAPTAENIKSNKYPFVIPIYAVTRSDGKENPQKIVQWLLSPAGQKMLNDTGYVGVK
ncbi:PstS family phosphate ABC transporter substrate-binding protein [Xylocopilactobacillus apicola]|uniref:PBP domain-containing protein n=1 Tax=Xylocopilactobacillus apicola TaxID=2932184 RepID=A0AAU9D8Q1_9LACO|nr:substrate-binding domain-containing protein [Xylocopilactobacillus apicola]BDR57850.1 hypothetical protein XA3_02910 [Xylocopilactobacillus apicola]